MALVDNYVGKVLPTHESKARKPLIERRRREKINNYLDEMKALVLQAMNKDESEFSKMEKADILEMTANYLKSLKRQAAVTEMKLNRSRDKYQAGYQDYSVDVKRYLATTPEYHQFQMMNLSQMALRCQPSQVPATHVTLVPSSPAVISPMLPSPSLSSSPPELAQQFRFPTPPPSPTQSCDDARYAYQMQHGKAALKQNCEFSTTHAQLWRPWC